MLRIDIWSDIACPFCYIGKRHLELALKSFLENGKTLPELEIVWRSFELNPDAQLTYEQDRYQLLAEKYNQPLEWAHQACKDMAAKGQAVGLQFDFDANLPTNTLDAHRLVHLAAEQGLTDEAKEALFEAYFRDGKLISNQDVLLTVAENVGLEREAVIELLNGTKFVSEVRQDQQLAQQYNITSVPYFVFNQKYAMPGAQPVETIVQVIEQVLAQE